MARFMLGTSFYEYDTAEVRNGTFMERVEEVIENGIEPFVIFSRPSQDRAEIVPIETLTRSSSNDSSTDRYRPNLIDISSLTEIVPPPDTLYSPATFVEAARATYSSRAGSLAGYSIYDAYPYLQNHAQYLQFLGNVLPAEFTKWVTKGVNIWPTLPSSAPETPRRQNNTRRQIDFSALPITEEFWISPDEVGRFFYEQLGFSSSDLNRVPITDESCHMHILGTSRFNYNSMTETLIGGPKTIALKVANGWYIYTLVNQRGSGYGELMLLFTMWLNRENFSSLELVVPKQHQHSDFTESQVWLMNRGAEITDVRNGNLIFEIPIISESDHAGTTI